MRQVPHMPASWSILQMSMILTEATETCIYAALGAVKCSHI